MISVTSKDGTEKQKRIVFRITERTINAEAEPFLLPELAVDTQWSNLSASVTEIIRLYEDHGYQ